MKRLLPLLGLLGLLAGCSSNKPAVVVAALPDLPAKAVSLKARWSESVGNGAGGEALSLRLAADADTLYAAAQDGVVKAVARDTGQLRWRIRLDAGLTAGAAVAGDLLLVATAQSELVALNVKDGSRRWGTPLGANLLAVPRAAGDAVVVQTLDGQVQVFAREDGKRRWHFDTPVPPLSLRGNASPLVVNDKVYAVSGQGDLYQLDLATGLPEWQIRVTNSRGRGELERLMDIDGDLVVDDKAQLYSAGFQSQLSATDVSKAVRRWQITLSTTQGVAVDAANVYAVDADGTLAAVNRDTGKITWKQEALKGRRLLMPVLWRDQLVVGDRDGYLHLFNPQDGAPIGRQRAARQPLMHVLVVGDRLHTQSVDGTLRAWDLLP